MALNVMIVERNPPTEKGDTYVAWDDYEVSPNSLWTDGIGSCLAIALYVPELQIGTLAHISGVRCPSIIPEAVYPENIVNTMASRLRKYTMEAVLAGEDNKRDISEIVKKSLDSWNIPIVGEDLGGFGGTRGREVHFNCQTREATIYRLPSLY